MSNRARILELLRKNGEMSSLDLVAALGGSGMHYSELRALADSGVIVRRETDERYKERGDRPRVYYSLPKPS